MKQIPNVFTLLNLVFGCIAIVYILQPGILLLPLDDQGNILVPPAQLEYSAEKMMIAPIFIAIAGLIDFLDGFVARALKAESELGKQLDSLADVVSFGVAPGMIIFQFLRMSLAQESGALDASFIWLVPAFIVPAAAAYRLGRFNIDQNQSPTFLGVPAPAAGLTIASFPLVYWYTDSTAIIGIMTNKWFWYVVILVISYLMISRLPMLSLKFKGINFKKLTPWLIILVVGIMSAFMVGWLAVAIGFLAYVIISLGFGRKAIS